jgi:FkbM family methyltransferase
VQDHGNLPFRINTESELARWRAHSFYTKEPETIAWIDSVQGGDDLVFIDVGANLGLYSLYAASTGRFKEIHAVECVPHTLNLLQENISLNEDRQNIFVHPVALFDEICKVEIQMTDLRPGAGLNRVRPRGYMHGPSSSAFDIIEVDAITGDLLIDEIAESKFFVKVDTDGSELEVLLGFEKAIERRNILSILVETSSTTSDNCRSFLTSRGYIEQSHEYFGGGSSRIRRKKNAIDADNLIFVVS